MSKNKQAKDTQVDKKRRSKATKHRTTKAPQVEDKDRDRDRDRGQDRDRDRDRDRNQKNEAVHAAAKPRYQSSFAHLRNGDSRELHKSDISKSHEPKPGKSADQLFSGGQHFSQVQLFRDGQLSPESDPLSEGEESPINGPYLRWRERWASHPSLKKPESLSSSSSSSPAFKFAPQTPRVDVEEPGPGGSHPRGRTGGAKGKTVKEPEPTSPSMTYSAQFMAGFRDHFGYKEDRQGDPKRQRRDLWVNGKLVREARSPSPSSSHSPAFMSARQGRPEQGSPHRENQHLKALQASPHFRKRPRWVDGKVVWESRSPSPPSRSPSPPPPPPSPSLIPAYLLEKLPEAAHNHKKPGKKH